MAWSNGVVGSFESNNNNNNNIHLYNGVGDGGVCDIPHWIGGKVLSAI